MTIDEIRTLALNLSREERELLGVELLSTLGAAEDQEVPILERMAFQNQTPANSSSWLK